MVADETRGTQRAPPRKRASGACLACRARKVRCDVTSRGAPCTNCILDKNQCTVKARPSKYRTGQTRTDKSSKVTDCCTTASVSKIVENTNESHLDSSPPNDARGYEITAFPNLRDEKRGRRHDTSNCEDSSDQPRQDMSVDSARQIENRHPEVRLPSASQSAFVDTTIPVDSTSVASIDTDVIFSFYSFLELDIHSHMTPQDVNFLEQQSCFRVPTRPALDELIREYFLHVHPCLPMLDEGKFWEMYTYCGFPSTERPRISLFVFQAMLFASCSFVSLACIRKLGFPNTRAARSAYYRRAKLLFDFNGEIGSISTAQGALLLTYNSSMRNYKKINTFWLGIAIQCAKDGDAHQYYTKSTLTAERRNILKRLWWCCILRDRILPLGVRRPLHISATDFEFEVAPLSKEDFESEVETSKVYSSCTKSSLIDLFIALCSLATSLTGVIMTLYPLNGSLDLNISDDEKSNEYFASIESCKSNLTLWFENATTEFPTPAGIGNVHESVILYKNLMYIYYHSAMLAVYHHEVLVIATKPTVVNSRWNRMCHNKRQVEEAANAVTDNLKELVQLKLAKYLPISVVAYAALPLVLHVLDIKLSRTDFEMARRQSRLKIYTEAMKVLQSHYDGTDEVSDIIGAMINYFTLGRPIQERRFNVDGDTIEHHQNVFGSSSASFSPIKHSKGINDWGDVLLRRTNLYLRLAITMDLSLSKGRFPNDADFPTALQSPSQIETRFPLYRITLEDTPESDTGPVRISSDGHYSSSTSTNTQLNNNLFHTALMSANNGFVRQIEFPLNNSTENPETSTYPGGFDMGVPENCSSGFDHSAAWADGMFVTDE